MSTTNLFVELLIVGIGAFAWVLLIILGVSSIPLPSIINLIEIELFIPLLSVIYVLGIVVDRLADTIFDKYWGIQIRESIFPDKTHYYRARSLIFSSSESISDLLEYNRSRLRICRGWSLNSVMIILALNLYALLVPATNNLLTILGTVLFSLFAIGSWYAWRNILKKEYSKTKHQSELIEASNNSS